MGRIQGLVCRLSGVSVNKRPKKKHHVQNCRKSILNSAQCCKAMSESPRLSLTAVRHGHGVKETDAEFDTRYVNYFNRPDIDGWECRKAMNDLCGEDMVPEPQIIIAALNACRRLNDFA